MGQFEAPKPLHHAIGFMRRLPPWLEIRLTGLVSFDRPAVCFYRGFQPNLDCYLIYSCLRNVNGGWKPILCSTPVTAAMVAVTIAKIKFYPDRGVIRASVIPWVDGGRHQHIGGLSIVLLLIDGDA